jgi:hypothetical protein
MTAFNVRTVNLIVGHDATNPVLARRIDDARQLTQPDADVSWLADIRAILYSVIFQPELETRIDSVLAEIMSGDTQQYRRSLTVALVYDMQLHDALPDDHPGHRRLTLALGSSIRSRVIAGRRLNRYRAIRSVASSS